MTEKEATEKVIRHWGNRGIAKTVNNYGIIEFMVGIESPYGFAEIVFGISRISWEDAFKKASVNPEVPTWLAKLAKAEADVRTRRKRP